MNESLHDDPIALLLPGESPARTDLARRLSTALRVFASDALDSGSPSVHVQLKGAREELVSHRREQVRGWLRAVLTHLAARCRPASSFATLPAPAADYTTAWGTLLGWLGDEREAFGLEIPEPGVSPFESFDATIGALECWTQRCVEAGVPSTATAEVELWRARRTWFAGDTAGACDRLEEILGRLARVGGRTERALREEALADRLALQLDRGALADATDTIARAGPVPERPADCTSTLHALVLVARWLGGGPTFPRLDAVFDRVATWVPEPWRELSALIDHDADDESDAACSLVPDAAGRGERTPLERRAFGAQALVVLAVDERGRTRRVVADVAPALEPAVERWCEARRDAIAVQATIENDVVRTGRAALLVRCVERDGDAERIDRSCLDAERGRALALAVVPVLREGDVVGLVWLECAHRLTPCAARRTALSRLAAGWLETPRCSAPAVHLHGVDPAAHGPRARAARSELKETWAAVVRGLGLKTAERRWVAFHRAGVGRDLAPVAEGGEAEARLGPPSPHGAWAIRRALRAGGFVRYGTEPHDARPSMLHPRAASGAALAIGQGPEVDAVLVVESVRRGDSRERDVARWFEVLQRRAPLLECAALHARDRVDHDGGFVVDADAPDERESLARSRAIARRHADVLVVGEPGSGRRTTARALFHAHRSVEGAGELVQLAGFGLDADALRRGFERGPRGAVLIAGVEWLPPAAQAELARWLALPLDTRPRVLATRAVPSAAAGSSSTESSPSGADGVGRPVACLHPDLVRHLGRLTVPTRPLREARHRIPALARFLVCRCLADDSAVVPRAAREIEDEAVAVLWRQPWAGNVAALEATLQSALLRARGDAIGVSALERAFEDVGLGIEPRLPSRDPAARDVAAAAWTTKTATGRMNKTRAALFLGWDPNTLAARLRDLGLASLEDAEQVLAGRPR